MSPAAWTVATVVAALAILALVVALVAAFRRPAGPVDPDLKVDAGNRAWRTFLAGLAIDVAVAVAMVVAANTSSVDAWQGWAVVGATLARTVAQTTAAYVLRRFLDRSSFPTPLPPGDPGRPADG